MGLQPRPTAKIGVIRLAPIVLLAALLCGVDLKIDAVRDLLGTKPVRYLARESIATGRQVFTYVSA